MSNLKGTTEGQLGKYTEALIEQLESSMTRGGVMEVSVKPGKVKIKDSSSNRKIIQQYAKLAATRSTEQQAKNLVLEVVNGGRKSIVFYQFEKPFSKPKKGDLGEGVIAAAIGARFIHKKNPIGAQQVKDVLNKLKSTGIKRYPGKKGTYVQHTFKAPNKKLPDRPAIEDDVFVKIALSFSAMEALLNKNSEYGKEMWGDPKVMEAYIRSACLYVNKKEPREWSEKVWANGRYDKIDVISDGLSAQKDTKVDTYVRITNDQGKSVPVNINLSMKVDDVKQFGQVSGVGFDVQEELWGHLFGLKSQIHPLQKKYNTLLQVDKKPIEAANMVYEKVADLANNLIQHNRTETIRHLAEGITYFATLHQPHVVVLNLGKGGTKIYNYEAFDEALSSVQNLRVYLKTQKKGYYQMNIGGNLPGKKEKDLLQIRIRVEPKSDGTQYIRNLIEKNPLLGDLLAETIT